MQKNVFLIVDVSDLSKNCNVKVTRICDLCFKEEEGIGFNVIMRGRLREDTDRCKSCSCIKSYEKIRKNMPYEKTLRYNFADISLEWDDFKNGNSKPDNVFTFSHKKVWWVCPNDTSHSYLMAISKRSGDTKQGCSICANLNQSKGERKIFDYLKDNDNKTNFISQYTFKDCKNINVLRFDFAVFDEKDCLKLLIEYDGRQHFEPVNFGGITQDKAINNFEEVVNNDKIKDDYCKLNKIKFLRISYIEDGIIEEILDSNLESKS